MKRLFYILILTYFIPVIALAQTAPVPDEAFLQYLKTNYPNVIDANDQLIIAEAEAVTGTINCYNLNISTLEGIQYFTNLQFLYAAGNNLSTLPDISSLTDLQVLNVSENQLSALPDISSLSNLRKLLVYSNQLQTLPGLTGNSQLTDIAAYNNQLTTLPALSHLTNLRVLEVGGNQLQTIPDLAGLTALENLLAWNNKIQELPDLSTLQSLRVLNVSANLLHTSPDLSANTALEEVVLNHNVLTAAPELSNHPALQHVILEQNYLSFEALLPYAAHPEFTTVFSLAPQRVFQVAEDKEVVENQTLTLTTGIDQNTSGVSYEWIKDGLLLVTTTTDMLELPSVNLSDAGEYTCLIKHSAIPDLTLKTDTFQVSVLPCLDISSLSLSASGTDCIKTGHITIDTSSVDGNNLTYKLVSPSTGKAHISQSGQFKGLTEPEYLLTVESGPSCTKTYGEVKLEVKACEDVFITPDNDGEKDSYYIAAKGTAKVYDKNGKLLRTFSLPAEWDGTTNSGLVDPGYYVVEINGGENFINISVIY